MFPVSCAEVKLVDEKVHGKWGYSKTHFFNDNLLCRHALTARNPQIPHVIV